MASLGMPVQANSKVRPKSSSNMLIGYCCLACSAGMKAASLSNKLRNNRSNGLNDLSKMCVFISLCFCAVFRSAVNNKINNLRP